MGNGTVISLGQVIVDLTMSVEKIPQPGQDVFADEAGIHVGASYNTLCAVRQMGCLSSNKSACRHQLI